MIVKFWGTRGSIPVCGKKFIKYGGNTTCVSIEDSNGDIVIIDCGTGIRNLGKEIIKKGIKRINIIFTHQHWDHVLGFPFFAPIYDKKTKIILTGCSYAIDDVKSIVSKIMQPPGFPIKFEEIDAVFEFIEMKKEGIRINNLNIKPIELSHPNGGFGYSFKENNKKVVLLTDNELKYVHPGGRDMIDYIEFSKNSDLLIADADYTDEEYEEKRTWGHSSFSHAVELAIKSSVKKLALFHHNQDRTDKEIDNIVKRARNIIKNHTSKIHCFAAYEGLEIVI